jgi:hypothetical protein
MLNLTMTDFEAYNRLPDKVAELRHRNHHREATILIAEVVGDIWLLERARSMKYVHDGYGYIPHHHTEKCAEVDRAAQTYLDDPPSWVCR